MADNIKNYFGAGHGYNKDEENQDFEKSMAGAADFLTNGLSNFKKKNNIDTSGEVKQYRKQAKDAFDESRIQEAEKYYDKLIQISSEDYDALFYKQMCHILNTGSTPEKLEELYNAYVMVLNNLPIEEDWNELELEYAKQFAEIVLAWFKKLQSDHRQTYDWYAHNLKEYYKYADLCKIAVLYMDAVMPIILKSDDISNYDKEWSYAWYYCQMCAGHCDATLYYKTTNRDLAITSNMYCGSLGYPLKVKAPIVEKYDAMCFEVRKFSKDFEVCGIVDEYGLENNEYGFDRMDPPTNYDNQQTRNRQTRAAQMAKDREIAQKVANWKSSGGREKDAREKRFIEYLSRHDEERTEYQTIKRDLLIAKQNLDYANEDLNKVIGKIDKYKASIAEMQESITKSEIKVEKLEKRVLFKNKAHEKAESLKVEIDNTRNEIVKKQEKLTNKISKANELNSEIKELEELIKSTKRKLELFSSNCLY